MSDIMFVSEALSDCGLCPECGSYVEMTGYKQHEDYPSEFLIYGECSNGPCKTYWKWVVATEEQSDSQTGCSTGGDDG